MKKAICLLGLLLSFAFLPAQADKRPERLTPELLWQLGRLSDVQVSPNGQYAIFGVTYYDLGANEGQRDIYIMALDRKSKPDGSLEWERLTEYEGSEWNARWHPDGKKIGFLSAVSGHTQLYEIDLDGGNLHPVSEFGEGEGISNFAYAPDGKHVSFTRDVKLEPTVNEIYRDLPYANARIIDDLMYRHWNGWHDYKYSHVMYMDYENGRLEGEPVDIMQGDRYDSPLNPFGGDEQIAWTSNGQAIAYTVKRKIGKDYSVSTNSDIYLFDLRTGEAKNLTEGMMGYDIDPSFSPDGKWMAWLSMEREGFESDRNRIFLMDMQKGTKKELTTGFDQSAGNLSWSADGKTLYFISGVAATFQLYSLDIASGKISQITQGDHNYYSVAPAGKGRLIATRASISNPVEMYEVLVEGGAQRRITDVNESLMSGLQMGKVEKRMIPTSDGKDMLTWVIYPPDFDPAKKYPTLLYCQGGPQSAVSQFFSYRWNFQLMAANGYIVVAPNRRGLPSFGQKWNDQISGDWGGQAMTDYLTAIDAMSKESFVDETKLGAVGASYGGYSVYYLAGIHNKRFKAFISHCGLFNLESWYGSTEEMFFANWDLGGPYWAKPRPTSYDKFSPHKLVGNWDTPILVIHGGKDFRVPETEGMQAFQAAQLQDIPSRFLYFPEEGHWILSPQNGVLWHRVFFDWLDRYLKDGTESGKDAIKGRNR